MAWASNKPSLDSSAASTTWKWSSIPLTILMGTWVLGLIICQIAGHPLATGRGWLIVAAAMCILATFFWMIRRYSIAMGLALVSVTALAMVRVGLQDQVHEDHVSRWLGGESQLAQVTGIIDGPSRATPQPRGALAHVLHQTPGTLVALRLESICCDQKQIPVSGRLLVKMQQNDHRLHSGDRVRMTGWLGSFTGPANPGETDHRKNMMDAGYDARLIVSHREQWERLEQARSWLDLAAIRQWISDSAHRSMLLGLRQNVEQPERDARRLAFLDTILLGRWSNDLGELTDDFKRTGLIHILCISGAHFAILAALVWVILRLLPIHPRSASMVMMIILAWYLLAVPSGTPVTRAGIMAAVFSIAAITGRRAVTIEALSLAALLMLIYDPRDLTNAGFQLSFITSAGMILWARPMAQRWFPAAIIEPANHTMGLKFRRYLGDYVAVNVVACVMALPLVAFHFSMVSPFSLLTGLLALPIFTGLLWLGLVKVGMGLVLPSAGLLLARPLEWYADGVIAGVEWISRGSFTAVRFSQAPSVACTLALLFVGVAWLQGWFTQRRWALSVCVTILAGWMWFGSFQSAIPKAAIFTGRSVAGAASSSAASSMAMRINMFSVGDGSCFLVRLAESIPGAGTRGKPYTLMFDCGSQQYLDVGLRSIAPALASLGVKEIDTLFLSHADMDHICGSVDVAERLPIHRLLITPQLLEKTEREPWGVVNMVIRGLEKRGAKLEVVSLGWHESHGGAELELIWPPADATAPRANDVCMALSIRTAGRRLLLNGDIQEIAMRGLFARQTDLRADILDLPHHGSFVPSSVKWFTQASPSVVLQSTGPNRLRVDKWALTLDRLPIERWITARQGMVQVTVRRDGRIGCASFKNDGSRMADDQLGNPETETSDEESWDSD